MAASPAPAVQDGRSIIMTAIAELDKVFQPTSQAAECSQSARSARGKAAVQVSTPALMSVLPPSRKRQRLSWLAEEQLKQVRKPEQAYRPLSRQDLIGRIATFTLTLWDDRKPEGCTAVDFARDGWRCTGKKRGEVTCDVCKAVWHVSATAESVMGGEALQRDIRENHSKSCPWRYDSCPNDLYRLHLSAPPQQLLQETLQRAGSFPQDFSFEVKHHLTPQQVASLAKVARRGRAKSLTLFTSPETEYHRDGNANANENTLIAALYGWQVNASASSNSSTITPATTTASDPAPSVIVQCKLCARRLAVKGARSTTSDASPANSMTEEATIRSPDRLSSVDLASSHRRFCPYINPISESAQQKLGYEALLDRILQIDNHPSPDHVTFEPSLADRSKSNVRQTREALRYVKDLLEGGHAVKRKFSVS